MLARLAATAVLGVAVLAQVSSAQTQRKPMPFSFGLAAGSLAIDQTRASNSAIHNQAWGAQLDAAWAKKYLYVGIDMGPFALSDHASFTQNTTGGVKSSTASLMYFSAMAGPRTRPYSMGVSAMSFGLYAGVSGTTAKRSIDNCVNCTVNDLEIPGGAFVQPTVLIGRSVMRLRMSDRQYLGGDGIKYVVSMGVEFGGVQ